MKEEKGLFQARRVGEIWQGSYQADISLVFMRKFQTHCVKVAFLGKVETAIHSLLLWGQMIPLWICLLCCCFFI